MLFCSTAGESEGRHSDVSVIRQFEKRLAAQAMERLPPMMQWVVSATILDGLSPAQAALEWTKDEHGHPTERTRLEKGSPKHLLTTQKIAELRARAVAAMKLTYQQALGEADGNGTPIDQVPGLTKKICTHLRAAGIETVDDLTATSRGALTHIPKLGESGLREVDRVLRILEGEKLPWAVGQ